MTTMLQTKQTQTLTSDIKKLACEYDKLILEKLGFSSISNRGVQQNCPIHGGDNSSAFSYDRNKCCWSCFTHGCHNKFGNDILGLVRAIKHVSFNEAVAWIEEIIYDPEITAGYIPSVKENYDLKENKVLNEDCLNRLDFRCHSIEQRQFKPSTLQHFQCGESTNGAKLQHQRLMIPIRNSDGALIGFTGRSVYEKCSRTGSYHPEWANQTGEYSSIFPKWRHYPKGLNKSIELYNFHEAKKYIEKIGFCIIVEGPFDLWRLWEFGVKNTVATFGCSLSNSQLKKLLSIGCKCIGVCFDSDEAGFSGYNKTKQLYGSLVHIEKICLPSGKDPGSIDSNDYNSTIKPQLSVLKNRYANKDHNNNW